MSMSISCDSQTNEWLIDFVGGAFCCFWRIFFIPFCVFGHLYLCNCLLVCLGGDAFCCCVCGSDFMILHDVRIKDILRVLSTKLLYFLSLVCFDYTGLSRVCLPDGCRLVLCCKWIHHRGTNIRTQNWTNIVVDRIRRMLFLGDWEIYCKRAWLFSESTLHTQAHVHVFSIYM